MGWREISEKIRERMKELEVREEDLILVLDIKKEKFRRMLEGDFSIDDEFHVKGYLRKICEELDLPFEEIEKEYLEGFKTLKKTEIESEPQRLVYSFMIIFLSFLSIFLLFKISEVHGEPIAVLKNTSGNVLNVSGFDVAPGDEFEIYEGVKVTGNTGEVLIETFGKKIFRVKIRDFEVMVNGRGEGSRSR